MCIIAMLAVVLPCMLPPVYGQSTVVSLNQTSSYRKDVDRNNLNFPQPSSSFSPTSTLLQIVTITKTLPDVANTSRVVVQIASSTVTDTSEGTMHTPVHERPIGAAVKMKEQQKGKTRPRPPGKSPTTSSMHPLNTKKTSHEQTINSQKSDSRKQKIVLSTLASVAMFVVVIFCLAAVFFIVRHVTAAAREDNAADRQNKRPQSPREYGIYLEPVGQQVAVRIVQCERTQETWDSPRVLLKGKKLRLKLHNQQFQIPDITLESVN